MSTAKEQWDTYLKTELPKITALLSPYHITLDAEQPHTKGERFLMQALTTVGGKKLILLGTKTTTNERVVIKATNDVIGTEELTHERACRTLLHSMRFSYESFHSPKEVLFLKKSGYTIFVSEFIEQTSSFLERPLAVQFSYALRALKAQERTRATTSSHFKIIGRVFGNRTADNYLTMFDAFLHTVKTSTPSERTLSALTVARTRLQAGKAHIEQYGGFLTHTDFVPHNFRIKDDTLYLLDFSSLRFGNKHESWARFLNFMTLYNRDLEMLLLEYVTNNRAKEEQESLTLMRLFRLGEIIAYYTGTLAKSTDNLRKLNDARIVFWTEVLTAELAGSRVSDDIVETYKHTRDTLRSDDEKKRQVGLH